jgi:FtsH-binding integral membrane protein
MAGVGVLMRPVIPALSLVAVSAVFFWFVAAIITNMLVTSVPPGSGLREVLQLIIPYHLQGILSLISLAGCIVFLATTRSQNPSWSLGLPLCIALVAAAVFSVLSKVILISVRSPLYLDPGYLFQLLSFVATSLLPLCSALFFLSRKKAGDRVNTLFTVALILGVLSLLLLIAMFFQASPMHRGRSGTDILFTRGGICSTWCWECRLSGSSISYMQSGFTGKAAC